MTMQEIKQLQKKRDTLNSQLSNAKDKLNLMDSHLEKDIHQLKTLKRQYALTMNQIRSTDNEIFQLKKKLNALKEIAARILPEFESNQGKLNQLEQSREQQKTNIQNLKENIQQEQEQNKQLRQSIAKENEQLKTLLANKQQLSDDISSQLSKTELNQEKVESDLYEISEKYISRLNEKNQHEQNLSKLESEINLLKQKTNDYKIKLTELTRVKVLTKDLNAVNTKIDQHQKDSDLYDDKLATLKNSLANKKISLERITNENKHRNVQIQTLESTVGEYDKAMNEYNKIKGQDQQINDQLEKDIRTIRQILNQKNGMINDLKLSEEKVAIVVDECLKVSD